MTASQHIKTPTMALPILSTVNPTNLTKFCQTNTRLTLSEIVDEVTVQERLTSKQNNESRSKKYTVRLQFYPRKDYVAEHSITPEQILTGVQKAFVPLLDKAIVKEIKQNEKETKSQVGDMGKARKVSARDVMGAGEDDDEEGGADERPVGRDDGEEEDGDADDARRQRQGKDEKEYESDDDEDEEDEEAEMEKKFGSKKGKKIAADSDSDSDEEPVDGEELKRRSAKDSLARMKQMESAIVNSSRYVDEVHFDMEQGEFCEFELEVRLEVTGFRTRLIADQFAFTLVLLPRPQASPCWYRRGRLQAGCHSRGSRHCSLLRRQGRQRERRCQRALSFLATSWLPLTRCPTAHGRDRGSEPQEVLGVWRLVRGP